LVILTVRTPSIPSAMCPPARSRCCRGQHAQNRVIGAQARVLLGNLMSEP